MEKKSYPNRKYQDSIFNKLFSNKEKALELYNALENTSYGPETKVEITTLENVLFLEMCNDLGFTVDEKYIVMAENQSTVNPNIPLRLLEYAAGTFEKIVDTSKIYGSRRITLPTPVFYVFYTGNESWDVKSLSLSDSYAAKPPENSMDLVVKMINLRYNKDSEILNRSKTLTGYSKFVTYVKENLGSGMPLETAIRDAMKACIDEGYLVDFLKKYGEEIAKMKFYEFTMKEYEELIAKESYEEGQEAGMKEGLAAGMRDTVQKIVSRELSLGAKEEDLVQKLMEWFDFSREQAQTYIKK